MRLATRLLILILVVTIAALLVLPRIVGDGGSRIGAVKSDLATIKSLVDQFKLDNGRYPTSAEGLRALTSMPPGLRRSWIRLSSRPVDIDRWGHPYLYESDGRSYTIRTLGADGKLGGEGEDADLEVND